MKTLQMLSEDMTLAELAEQVKPLTEPVGIRLNDHRILHQTRQMKPLR